MADRFTKAKSADLIPTEVLECKSVLGISTLDMEFQTVKPAVHDCYDLPLRRETGILQLKVGNYPLKRIL